ncbi:Uu.00g075200.m01.CDS01 [Anthostomella pinea]|uniref:Uu.00g075200.m01.CDS01 n=1 Tax=Anthostomella pinea TaxID=933095 RepID=A0AAI8VWI4_9PEZI|nr:Uu.00g075200.m01.CDS01 [Anthostomella pinea]
MTTSSSTTVTDMTTSSPVITTSSVPVTTSMTSDSTTTSESATTSESLMSATESSQSATASTTASSSSAIPPGPTNFCLRIASDSPIYPGYIVSTNGPQSDMPLKDPSDTTAQEARFELDSSTGRLTLTDDTIAAVMAPFDDPQFLAPYYDTDIADSPGNYAQLTCSTADGTYDQGTVLDCLADPAVHAYPRFSMIDNGGYYTYLAMSTGDNGDVTVFDLAIFYDPDCGTYGDLG